MANETIETIVLDENSKYTISAQTKHRVRRDERGMPYLEISRNGGQGFWQFSTDVTYHRFGSTYLHQSGITKEELENLKIFQ